MWAIRLPDGKVANGNWNPDNSKVNFNWNNADNRNSNIGGREEVSHNKEPLGFFCVWLGSAPVWIAYVSQPLVIFEISMSCS